MSFEEGPGDDPIYRANPNIRDSADGIPSYINVDETLTANGPSPRVSRPYSEIDLRRAVPVQNQNTDSVAEDYENAPGMDYENCSETKSSKNHLAPPSVNGEPPLPPRNSSTDREKVQNLFRQGTKAYQIYNNALQDYELSPKQLEKRNQIGKGNFSTVYSGVATKLPHTNEKN